MVRTVNRYEGGFKAYQFFFALILAHEVGAHLLVTYMNLGGAYTPHQPPFTVPYFHPAHAGETGRLFEGHLLGGQLQSVRTEHVRNPEVNSTRFKTSFKLGPVLTLS